LAPITHVERALRTDARMGRAKRCCSTATTAQRVAIGVGEQVDVTDPHPCAALRDHVAAARKPGCDRSAGQVAEFVGGQRPPGQQLSLDLAVLRLERPVGRA
jgi:hypothetical protein